jgi:hypothetical protein
MPAFNSRFLRCTVPLHINSYFYVYLFVFSIITFYRHFHRFLYFTLQLFCYKPVLISHSIRARICVWGGGQTFTDVQIPQRAEWMARNWEIGLISQKAQRFLSYPQRPDRLRTPIQPAVQQLPGALFPRPEANHWSSHSAEVKCAWRSNSTSTICISRVMLNEAHL